MLRLPPHLVEELRRPLGDLIRGTKSEICKKLLDKVQGKYIISVGDVVSKTLLNSGVPPAVIIADGKTLRQEVPMLSVNGYLTLEIENPSSSITAAALSILKEILSKERKMVFLKVRGEEDLLGLPALLYAPEGAVVVYGQPGEGVVVVQINQLVKGKAKKILEQFEDC